VRAIVIGAGVSGLSTAIRLREAEIDAHVVSRERSPQTTSDVAAAFWYPYRVGPRERVMRWAKVTAREFERLADDDHSGVSRRCVRQYSSSPAIDPWMGEIADGYRTMSAPDLFGRWRSGVTFDAYLAETPIYLPYLQQRFADLGGRVEHRDIASIDELLPNDDAHEDTLIVDCAGLGARELAHDESVHPIRGQVLCVRRPPDLADDVLDSVDDDWQAYVVPRRDDVIMGGTAIVDDWTTEPDEQATRAIIERCAALCPALAKPEILRIKVGLRPGRPTVRLEREERLDGRCLIHNYGHGGAGFTLSWGCADEATRLALAHLV